MAGREAPQRQTKPGREVLAAVRGAIEPVVAAAGCDLEDLQLRTAGSRLLLRVLIDADGGVTLDDAAAVAGEVSRVLDESTVMGARPYVLDVGSPGVDRPLTLLRHWRRNTGRLVRIIGADGGAVTGRIAGALGTAADAPPTAVSIDCSGKLAEIPAGSIRRAVVQVEFTDATPLED